MRFIEIVICKLSRGKFVKRENVPVVERGSSQEHKQGKPRMGSGAKSMIKRVRSHLHLQVKGKIVASLEVRKLVESFLWCTMPRLQRHETWQSKTTGCMCVLHYHRRCTGFDRFYQQYVQNLSCGTSAKFDGKREMIAMQDVLLSEGLAVLPTALKKCVPSMKPMRTGFME